MTTQGFLVGNSSNDLLGNEKTMCRLCFLLRVPRAIERSIYLIDKNNLLNFLTFLHLNLSQRRWRFYGSRVVQFNDGSSLEGFVGPFAKELALNRPLRKASGPRHLDQYPPRILDMWSLDYRAHASLWPHSHQHSFYQLWWGKKANISTTMAVGKQDGPTDPSNPMYIMKPLADQLANEICKMLEKRA
jgi:hypothetical protein